MQEQLTKQSRFTKRDLIIGILIVIIIPLVIILGAKMFADRYFYIVSLLIIGLTMIPFFVSFEKSKPTAKKLIIIAVLSAIAVAGRTLSFIFPQVNPIMAVIILAGISLGPESGFLTGSVTAFVSNFFFGQGSWTPWQMLAFGIVGFIAGLIYFKGRFKPGIISICVFGFIATTFISGTILDWSFMLMYMPDVNIAALLGASAAGIWFNVVFGIATLVFLLLIGKPMLNALDRIKTKYGLED